MYDLLLIPGLELTYDDLDPCRAGHAVAVGLRAYVDVSAGLESALVDARAAGAALIAAHPYSPEELAGATRGTAAFSARPELAELVDRYELFNRDTATWKSLLPCAKDDAAIVAYLRSARPAYLVRLEDELSVAA